MRGVILTEFGAPEVLVPTELPEPQAGDAQVIIDVTYAGVTFVETQLRAGRPPNPAMLPRLPAVLGNAVGGVIVAIGAGVDPSLLGRPVVSSTGGSGGYAARAAVQATAAIPVPDGLALADAVALLADGRTALVLMDRAKPRSGEIVLIEAAAGGVGTLLTQLAHNVDAKVVALARGGPKLELVRRLGADAAIDYGQTGWADVVRGQVPGIDVVFDGVGGEIGQAAFALLRRGGRLCSYGMASGRFTDVSTEEAAARGVALLRGAPVAPEALLAFSKAALAEAAAGRLRPVIGQIFPLAEAARAHAAIEARATVGKTLLATGT